MTRGKWQILGQGKGSRKILYGSLKTKESRRVRGRSSSMKSLDQKTEREQKLILTEKGKWEERKREWEIEGKRRRKMTKVLGQWNEDCREIDIHPYDIDWNGAEAEMKREREKESEKEKRVEKCRRRGGTKENEERGEAWRKIRIEAERTSIWPEYALKAKELLLNGPKPSWSPSKKDFNSHNLFENS